MTEKQKQAIIFINELKYDKKVLTIEEYFLLMEFIIGQHVESTYPTDPSIYPWTRRLTEDSQPLDPVYGEFGKVICNQNTEQ